MNGRWGWVFRTFPDPKQDFSRSKREFAYTVDSHETGEQTHWPSAAVLLERSCSCALRLQERQLKACLSDGPLQVGLGVSTDTGELGLHLSCDD